MLFSFISVIPRFSPRYASPLFNIKKTMRARVERAWAYVLSFCDEVRAGQFEPEDFVVSKVLRKPLEAYRSMAPHVAAAWNLRQAGMRVEEGDLVDFIFVAEHRNPLRRVQPVYDGRMGRVNLEKYVDLVKASANSVLEVFMT